MWVSFQRTLQTIDRAPSVSMGVDRHKPISRQVIELTPDFKATQALFLKHGWIQFLDKFNGYDDEISSMFAQEFREKQVKIGDLILEVYEKTIVVATGLPMIGDHWFKKENVARAQINRILEPKYHAIQLGKGFPRHFLKDDWKQVLIILQKYITREGRYIVTLQYHI